MTDSDIQVHEGRRAGIVVSVRLRADEADLLEALSERDKRTMSETLRVALHSLASNPSYPAIAARGNESGFTRGGISEHLPKVC